VKTASLAGRETREKIILSNLHDKGSPKSLCRSIQFEMPPALSPRGNSLPDIGAQSE
jgi:hypothetical protein